MAVCFHTRPVHGCWGSELSAVNISPLTHTPTPRTLIFTERKPPAPGSPQAWPSILGSLGPTARLCDLGQDHSHSGSWFSSSNNLGSSEASSFSLLSPPLSSAGLATTSSCNLSWALGRRGLPSARGTCQLSRCEDGGPSRESEDLKPARPDRGSHT